MRRPPSERSTGCYKTGAQLGRLTNGSPYQHRLASARRWRLLRRRRPRVSWCRCRKARAGGVPTGPSVRPCSPAETHRARWGFRVQGPRQTREGGRDGRAQRPGRQADDRRRSRRALRPRRRPDLRRRLHHHPQPDGRGLRDRPPPHQGPAPGGALQRPGARRARRRRLRAPPRHRLRRQRPLRADLHPLPQGRRARRAAGRGLHQQHDEPALPRRRAGRPVHPQQVRPRDRRRREERLPARAARRGRRPVREGHRHRRPLRPRRRRGRPPPRAHARRLRSSTPSR